MITYGPEYSVIVDIDGTLCKEEDPYPLREDNYRAAIALDGACNAMWEIITKYRLYYVTSRGRSTLGLTQRWLEEWGFPKGDGIITNVKGSLKGLVAKALNARFVFDDKVEVANNVPKDIMCVLITAGGRNEAPLATRDVLTLSAWKDLRVV